VIEKELNTSIQEPRLNLKPENLVEKATEQVELRGENEQKENKHLTHTSPKKLLNAPASVQKADLYKSPFATDSENTIENFLSSNEKNNSNKVYKDSPHKPVNILNNIKNNSNYKQEIHENANAQNHAEKSTIFINNAISNTNQSKLKNLFETNKEKDSTSKITSNESESYTYEDKLDTRPDNKNTISTASNLEFSSKPIQHHQKHHQIINDNNYQQANLNKNLIQESSTILTLNKISRNIFEENAISVENNSFGVFSAPKNKNIVSCHQAHNFTFRALAPQQNKFNLGASVPQYKNLIMTNNAVTSNLTLSQQQIPNLSNLNKPNKQELNNKNENNQLNINMSPNIQFNPMMPYGNTQTDLSGGFQFAGVNPLQQGFYPIIYYYPPAQAENIEQYPGESNSAVGANAQMPYMPYPMTYYANPSMFGGQQEANKDENAGNVNEKARKNANNGNISTYHGMNLNVKIYHYFNLNFKIIFFCKKLKKYYLIEFIFFHSNF